MTEELTSEQRAALDALKSARGTCPAAETLIEYEALDASARARHAAHDHIQICSRCQLVLLHAAEPVPAQASSSLKWWLPLAAILVLGIAVTIVNRSGPPADPPAATVRGTEIQVIAPAGSVDAVTEFTWQSPIRAERFRVSVFRGSDRVWQTETAELRAAPPSGALERNVEYRWQVEAIDREGDVRMTSPPQPFTVR